MEHFETNQASPMSYAIKLKGVPHGYAEQEVIKMVYEHLEKYWMSKGHKKDELPVIDIAIAQQNELFFNQRKIKDIEEEMTMLFEELKIKEYISNDSNRGTLLDIKSISEQIDALPENSILLS